MDEVLFSKVDGIGRITINRPEHRNSLNLSVVNQLRQILQKTADDHEVRVLTLSGAGDKAFCAGGDLKAAYSPPPGGEGFNRAGIRQLLVDVVQYPKPTVALVRGHVMGGGLGLVLASDIALSCDDVWFSTPEVQVGMFPMMVMGLLYRNVGRKRATEMMYLGERITAGHAEEIGIINHAYPREAFDAEAESLIRKLANKSAAILRLGKEAISRLLDDTLIAEERFLEAALAEVMATEDSEEGLRAFNEKRPPKWN